MANKFPNVSFDWMTQLPERIEEGRARRSREEALADLESSDPESLRSAANKLLKSHDLKSMEMGLRLHQTAQAREALTQKSATEAAYMQNLPRLLEMNRANPIGGGQQPSGSTYDPIGAIPPQGPQPNFGPNPLAPPGPQGMRPQAPMAPTAAAGGPPQQLPFPQDGGPSEEVIAAAQGAIPREPMPGPTAQAGPPQAPQAAQLPEWVRNAQQGPVGPPQAPRRPSYGPLVDDEGAQQEATQAAEMLIRLGPKAPAGAVRAFTGRFNNALDRLKMSPDQKNYQLDRIQAIRMGEKDFSRSDWELQNKVGPELHKEMLDVSKRYEGEGDKAIEFERHINQMEAIAKHPKFGSGPGTEIWDRGVRTVAAMRDLARSVGVPESYIPDLSKITEPTALRDAFASVSNLAIFAKLGTLGNQISEGDRNFVERSFPNLRLSKEGNLLLLEIMRETVNHAKQAARVARDYREERGVRSDAPGMRNAVEKWANENRLYTVDDKGTLNERGKQLQDRIDKALSMGAGGAQGAPPVQTPKGTPVWGPKTRDNPSGLYLELPDGRIIPRGL